MFLARPLIDEGRQWAARWPAIRASQRTRVVALGAAAALVASFLPLDRSVSLPAVLAPLGDAPLATGDPAEVVAVLVRDGEAVAAGQPLVRLRSPAVALTAAQARLRIAELESQLARAAADRDDLANAAVLEHDLLTERDRLSGAERQAAALVLRAPAAGRVVDIPDGLAPGQWTDGRSPLARVVTPGRYDVVAYLPEDERWRLDRAGATGRFVADDGGAWRVRLDEVGASAVATLDQPVLAAANGGPIATAPGAPRAALVPAQALVAVRLVAEARADDGLPQPIAGRVVLPARGESLAARVARAVARVLVRESSVE